MIEKSDRKKWAKKVHNHAALIMGIHQRVHRKRVILYIGASWQKEKGIAQKSRWKKVVINARVLNELDVPKEKNVNNKEKEPDVTTAAKDTQSVDTPSALIPCRNFNNGKGSCPFGEKCFFSHIIINTSFCLPVRNEPTVDAEVYFKSLPKNAMTENDLKLMAEKFGCKATVRFLPENPKAQGRLAGFVNMDKEGAAWEFLKAFDGKHFQDSSGTGKAFVCAKMNHIKKDVPQPDLPQPDLPNDIKQISEAVKSKVDKQISRKDKAPADEWHEVTPKKQRKMKETEPVDIDNEIPDEWPALSPSTMRRPAIWPGSPMSTMDLVDFLEPVIINLPAPSVTEMTKDIEYAVDDEWVDDYDHYYEEEEQTLLSRLVNVWQKKFDVGYM